ncbi:hypothetical protein C4E22_02475 [ANME-1 cluster archaeon AG-394-G06]|nr:hypothetical protein [ANME-1 cluster archaeon AG-394-G06]
MIRGEIGTGKTSLLLWLTNTLKKTNKTKPVILEGIETRTKEILLSSLRRQRTLRDKLMLRSYPKNLVVFLDEGEKFPEEITEHLRLMWDRKDLYSIVIATTDPALENFTPAFKDRIGKTMVLSSIARGDLVEIIRKRAGDNNPFTSEAMIILAERYNSPRRLLEGCAEVCIYCADEGLGEVTEAVVEGYITRQTRQDVRLSPEQQKIADLVGRGVNTVKEIAKELDMGEAATRTQIKRMIEKGCVEVVSSERPKKYGLKLR